MELIIVAVVTLVAALGGAVVASLLQDRSTRRNTVQQARDLQRHRLAGLLTEVRENTILDDSGGWRKAPFATDAWEDAKADMQILEDDGAEFVRRAYMRVRKHNALLDYERERVNWGQGHLDDEIRASADSVVAAMAEAAPPISAAIAELRASR